MALDIGVGDGSSRVPIRDEPLLSLNDDAIYSFLHPLVERLRWETGQYIDLYGDASFSDWRLTALRRMLAQARVLAEAQPESGQVHVGTQIQPARRELWMPLTRKTLLDVISRWDQIVDRAEELGRPVVCYGD
jgi:hypothetical protein